MVTHACNKACVTATTASAATPKLLSTLVKARHSSEHAGHTLSWTVMMYFATGECVCKDPF